MGNTAPKPHHHVVAAVLEDGLGRVLVAKRPLGVHQGGLWEFPGGKREAWESPLAGLRRELREELGIRIRGTRPLIQVPHVYEDRKILLDVYRVLDFQGTPRGCEGQELRWIAPKDLVPDHFPAADRPVLRALRLPEYLLITGEDPERPDSFLTRLERALDRGIRLVQLRAHRLSDRAYFQLAAQAHRLCSVRGARLILNRPPDRIPPGPWDGIHLSGAQLRRFSRRPGPWSLLGASCHTAEELARAAELGVDYAVLSPVRPTASHPDAVPLGWEGFQALVQNASLPVYALGGLNAGDRERAIHRGAQGIAAIRGFWPA